jgi:hypothetical protein
MAEKKKAFGKKAAPKAEAKGTYKIKQSYPGTSGAKPQVLPMEFKSKKEAEAFVARKECCEIIKVG